MRNRQHARKSSISGLGRPTPGGSETRRESGLIRRTAHQERLEVETPLVLTIPPLSAPGDRIDYMKVARLRAAIEDGSLPIDARAIAEKLAVTGLEPLQLDAPADEAPPSGRAAPPASERAPERGSLAEPGPRRTSRRPRKP